MANISKIKRDELLGFLDEIELATELNNVQIEKIKQIKNEFIKKKYGLIRWRKCVWQ